MPKRKSPKSNEQLKERLEKQKRKREEVLETIGAADQAIAENAKLGAPSKYAPEFCQMLIAHMAKGFSYETFAAEVNATRGTLYNWEKEFPEFLNAKERGFEASQKFWEEMGVAGSAGALRNFNAGGWIFNMKNRFKWTDRQDVTSGGGNLPPAQVHVYLPSNGREIDEPEGSEQ